MSNLVEAPWTDEQVRNMNIWQAAGRFGLMHPFTCGKRGEPGHDEYAKEHNEYDWGILKATPEKWICHVCDYTQTWAHKFQTEPIPEEFLRMPKKYLNAEKWVQLEKLLLGEFNE